MRKESLDTIYIELNVVAVQRGVDDIWMQGDLEIRVNQKKPYDDSSDVVIVDQLLESLNSNGEYFIFSCCCGVPECSGWKKGIRIEHRENYVLWKNENTNEIWKFEKGRIEECIDDVRKEVENYKNFFNSKEISYVGVGYNW